MTSVSVSRKGHVALVGAGPGHPGLITLRAVELLRQADMVLYDRLVAHNLLDHAPTSAQTICVTELAPCHAERIAPIHDTMIAAARQGKRVVRLKGGDPLLFGRGGEEAQALAEAGISFEIVPGITAAIGAAAYAGIPLTHRTCASGVAIVTGHEHPDKPQTALDWTALARFPGTLVFYMGMSKLEHITSALVAAGKAPETPTALVQWVSLGQQRTVETSLASAANAAVAAGLSAPALVVVGPVVSFRGQMAWFERLPLFGQSVLVTRPQQQSAAMVSRLVELGAIPVVLPTITIRPPDNWRAVDAALHRLREFHWLVFTSANGVRMLLDRLPQVGLDLRALGGLRLAAIGPKTAEELRLRGLSPDLVPSRFQSEDLAAALQETLSPGQRVLLARADRGRELLRDELARHVHVEQVAVYEQNDAIDLDEEILGALQRGDVDYITLTSSNIARSLLSRLDDAGRRHIETGKSKIVTISPVTSAEVQRHGLPVALEAREATIDGIIEVMIENSQHSRVH